MEISCTNLGGGSNIASGQPDVRSPGNVPDPISVALQYFFLHPTLSVLPVPPDLDEVITTSSGEALDGLNGVGLVVWLTSLEVGSRRWGD